MAPTLDEALRASGHARPTEAQRRCWRAALAGRDVLCVAPTGSGKTLAYALPYLALRRTEASGSASALVLVPTRELAQQVARTCAPLCSVALAHGGVPRSEQLAAAAAAEMLVACPGRLLDLASRGSGGRDPLELGGARYVVVDEADKMLHAGLRDQLRQILDLVDPERQLLLVTATISPALEAFKCSTLRAPTTVRVTPAIDDSVRGPDSCTASDKAAASAAHPSEGAAADGAGVGTSGGASLPAIPPSVVQTVTVCAEHKKARRLLRLFDTNLGGLGPNTADKSAERVLIFANTVSAVHDVAGLIGRHGLSAEPLTSRLSQAEREAALSRFRSSETRVLVATDVAARGLHIEGLRYVVLYDFGTNIAQYVHRVGRTGRAGEAGYSYAFFTRNLRPMAPAVVDLLERHGQQVDPYLRELVGKRRSNDGSAASAESRGAEISAEVAAPAPAPAAVADGSRRGQRGRKRSRGGGAAPAPSGALLGHGDDDEMGGGAQGWLAARLISPITGRPPVFARDGLKGRRRRGDLE